MKKLVLAVFFLVLIFVAKKDVQATCSGSGFDGCQTGYSCGAGTSVASYNCGSWNGTYCPETYRDTQNISCDSGCNWRIDGGSHPQGCREWAPAGCTDENPFTLCSCTANTDDRSGTCCDLCPACTPTSCDAACPTGCGYGAGTVYGTDDCGGSCSISCPATGSCGEGEPTPTSPPPPPGIRNTLGWLDSAACTGNGVAGWGGDPDDINWNTDIHLYFDSHPVDANPAGVNIGAASLSGEKAICDRLTGYSGICAICATDNTQPQCRHRFIYQIPTTINRWYGGSINLRDGNTHTVKAFVINKSGTPGENLEVENGGVTFSCCTGGCGSAGNYCVGSGYTDASCGNWCAGTKCDAPNAPTPVSPSPGQTFSNVTYVDFSWSAPASWSGGGTCGSTGTYNVCIGTSSGSCNLVNVNQAGTTYRYYQSAAGTYYWQIQAVNNCGTASAYSSARTVVLTTQAKNCDIDLSAGEVPITGIVVVTMAANAKSSTGDTARLWIEKADGTVISPNNISPAATVSFSTYFYYNFGGSSCFTTTSACSTVTNVQIPKVGNYKFHCDLSADPGKCTGDPFCTFHGGTKDCSGWVSCPNGGVMVVDTSDGGGGDGGDGGTDICAEGFDPNNPAYLSAWGGWGACNVGHVRTRTRTCTEDCSGIQSCSAYFAANCPAGATCTTSGAGLNWTQTDTQTCSGQMTGTFFDGSDLSICPVDPQTLAANLKISGGTISLTGSTNYGPYTTDATGLFTTAATILSPDTYSLSVSPGSGFVAAPKFNCQGTSLTLAGSAPGCLTQPCETAPTTTHDFGFWKVYGGWWQGTGGSIYGGTGIASNIPGTMPVAQQKLVLQDASLQDGLAYYKSGTINLGTYPGVIVSTSGWNAVSGYGGDDQNYDYFTAKMATYAKIAWNGTGQPTYVGTDGYDIYTYTGDVTVNWSPGAGQKVIYLIKGNVTISGNVTVSTASPTFLAIIASGTITFNTGVTRADGWYVANALNFPTGGSKNDAQFDGRGSFIGYNSVTLARDQGILNNSQPAEKFSFRPDLVINAPAPILEARYVWRQE